MSSDNVLFWIWLQQKLGFASRFASEAVRMGGAEFFYDRPESELRSWSRIPRPVIQKLLDRDLSEAQAIYDRCLTLGYEVITPDDAAYPRRLLEIAGPPLVLYVSGTLPKVDDELCIGVVGTRSASQRGVAAAQELGLRLAEAGAIIVSGCAAGIDSASQQGAIMADGTTIGVLGCGIDTRYNMHGRELRRLVTLHGALVSEYPPGYPSKPENFPQRNRIISGLSNGVAVIEAGDHSGSTITARLALEQGRDLFAMPGVVGTENAVGVNRLLRDGAVPLTSPLDILSVYEARYAHKLCLDNAGTQLLSSSDSAMLSPVRSEPSNISRRPAYNPPATAAELPRQLTLESNAPAAAFDTDGLSRKAIQLYSAVTTAAEPLDAIAARAGMSAPEAARFMLELELNGAVVSLAGGCYSRA